MSLPNCYRCGSPYQDGKCGCKDGITLYHADCRDVLPGLEEVDTLLTDPVWPGCSVPLGGERPRPQVHYGRDRREVLRDRREPPTAGGNVLKPKRRPRLNGVKPCHAK